MFDLSKLGFLASSCGLAIAIRTRGRSLLGPMALIFAIYAEVIHNIQTLMIFASVDIIVLPIWLMLILR